MKFSSIKQIKAHKFAGNHFNDFAAFCAIEDFARDEKHSVEHRAEALRQMTDRGMGCGRTEKFSDAALLKEFADNDDAA